MHYGGRFADALGYATRLHRSQTRKSTDIPYVTHLLAVAALVGEAGGDEDEAIAALLHDAVEDQGGEATLVEIRERFGPRVADIVVSCTDAWEQPKPPWRARKEAWLASLETASPSVLLVSTADRLHNARSMLADLRRHGASLWERFNAGRDEQLWLYRAVIDLYRRRGAPAHLVDALARVVDAIDRER